MQVLRIIIGGILILLAVSFLIRIPKNAKSTDPKARSKVAADVVLVAVCGVGGGIVLWSVRKAR